MFSNFFIRRPIFASVLSIVILLLGVIAMVGLPIMQYPQISPPQVEVSAFYPGASAEDVERSVATPIEQQVNGANNMLYMNSKSSSDGSMSLSVTFAIGSNIDMDAVEVQNRVKLAEPFLPLEVIRQGLLIKKRSPDFLTVISIVSPDKSRDALFLSNYATLNIVDALARIPGVGDATVRGTGDYSMRIWIDPNKLTNLNLTPLDVVQALREQNALASSGRIGDPPMPKGQEFEYTVRVKGRLTEVSEFENVILRADPNGAMVRLRDVARVEMVAKTFNSYTKFNGTPCASVVLFQLPGSNALDVMKQANETMKELSKSFPSGVEYRSMYDSTKFVRASLREVLITLSEAMLLVFLVTFLFLQSWRATLIPCIAAPVSLIGAFILFQILGISINTVSLFGLVLAIGLVVDDAIVVVEAVQRHIEEENLSPYEASCKAMSLVTAPIVATTLVLFAVFAPVGFLGGITGQLYKQFAVSVCVSVAISAFNSLTLSPALCALLLKHHDPAEKKKHRGPLALFFALFNWFFDLSTRAYIGTVRFLLRNVVLALLVVLALGAGCWGFFRILPGEFVPDEDLGVMIIDLRLPQGASLERTQTVSDRIEAQCKAMPAVENVLCIGGQSIMTGIRATYANTIIVTFKSWAERESPDMKVKALIKRAQMQFMSEREAMITVFTLPSLPGVGLASATQFQLQDRSGHTPQELVDVSRKFIGSLMTDKRFAMAFTGFNTDTPQVDLQLDREKTKTLGVRISDIFDTLSMSMGGLYVNDFNKYGRTYRVQLQAEPSARSSPEDIGKFYVRSQSGEMIPLSTLTHVGQTNGPDMLTRYNLYRTAEIMAMPVPGVTSGTIMQAIKEKAEKELPQGYWYEWTGLSYQQAKASSQIGFILLIAVAFVFLTLAAQYESWIVPFAVILAIPVGVFGALASMFLRGQANSVYSQIGLVMLMGLAAKNAILIVEYARKRYSNGVPLAEATLDAVRLRFRPILMTSLAFIFGLFPLVVSKGAGAAARQTLGTVVFGGMIIATGLGVFVIPSLYVLCERIGRMLGIKVKSLE